jgi:hypothetical protein
MKRGREEEDLQDVPNKMSFSQEGWVNNEKLLGMAEEKALKRAKTIYFSVMNDVNYTNLLEKKLKEAAYGSLEKGAIPSDNDILDYLVASHLLLPMPSTSEWVYLHYPNYKIQMGGGGGGKRRQSSKKKRSLKKISKKRSSKKISKKRH